MKISYPIILLFLLFGTIAITSCSTPNSQSTSSLSETQFGDRKPIIYATNYPLKYFAEFIGGEAIQVKFPIPSNVDPAFWQPNAEIISQLQQGDLILINGATYEKWLDKVSLPESKLIDTSIKFQDQYIPIKSSITHSHGLEGKHSHTDIAFTTWLNLELALQQAQTIRDSLSQIMPSNQETFTANHVNLEQKLLDLDRQIQSIVDTKPEQKFITSHPVYDYLQQGYGMQLESVHWEPEQYPTEEQWQELQVLLQTYPAQWMIWEEEPLPETVTQLKNLGIDSLVFATVANKPGTGNFISIMQQNIENLQLAFSQ